MPPEVEAGQQTPAPEQPANAASQPEVTATPGSESKPDDQPPRVFTQEELDDHIKRRVAKESRKREELKREAEYWRRVALEREAKQREERPAQPAQPDAGEPKRDDFESYEAYLEARAVWRADKKVDERLAKQSEEASQKQSVAERQKLEQSFREKALSVAKEVEDFEDVMEGADAPMTKQMEEAILASDLGPRVAYYLAKNPGEAERIASLPGPRQAAEIGKLEARIESELKAPPKKEPSKAPEPIEPVGSRSANTNTEPTSRDSDAEWFRKREAQLRERRGK